MNREAGKWRGGVLPSRADMPNSYDDQKNQLCFSCCRSDVHFDGHRFTDTILFLIYDPAGQFVAMVKLHQNLTVSEGGDLSLPNLA
jgi:hypothetical protein